MPTEVPSDATSDVAGLPASTPVGAIADEAFDRIAALVRTVLGVPVGLVSLVDRTGQVFPGQSGLPEPWDELRCTPLTHSFCQYVVRTAQPLVVTDARSDPDLQANLAIVDIGVVGYAGIPLVDYDGSVVGSLCAIDTEPHEWTSSEVALLRDLAATCSAEIQLRSAVTAAREAQDKTTALLELSEALAQTHTTADVSRAVADFASTRLGAAFAGVVLLDTEGPTLTYVDVAALPEALRSDYAVLPMSGRTPAADAAMTGNAVYLDDLDAVRRRYPDAADALIGTEVQSCAYFPLQAAGRIFGTIAVLWPQPRQFDADDKALLLGLSRSAGQAVERALLLADRRHVAETLQAAMLPTLPRSELAELATRYFPARVADAVGGDWYDAHELADGSLAVSVGDVEGHDTVAAAVMGQLRATLRGLTIALASPPGRTLSALDAVLNAQPSGRRATGVLAHVRHDGDRLTFSWSNAGHPPPLVLRPGQPPAFLRQPSELILGTPFAPPTRSTHTTTLAAGSTLILFTDGLLERRDQDLDERLHELARSAGRHRDLDLSPMVDAIVGELLGGQLDDDVVILGLRTRADRRSTG